MKRIILDAVVKSEYRETKTKASRMVTGYMYTKHISFCSVVTCQHAFDSAIVY